MVGCVECHHQEDEEDGELWSRPCSEDPPPPATKKKQQKGITPFLGGGRIVRLRKFPKLTRLRRHLPATTSPVSSCWDRGDKNTVFKK